MKPADEAPDDYQEPFETYEWGVALETGESVRQLSEDLARMVADCVPDRVLMRRRVVYDPWLVMPKEPREAPNRPTSSGG